MTAEQQKRKQDLELAAELVERVRIGQLSPEEADEAAFFAGMGSLSRVPSPDEYWPTSEPNWTLPMVLAWIAWRTFSEVREWDAKYVPLRVDWGPIDRGRGTAGPAYTLFRRKRPTSEQFLRWGGKRFGPWIADSNGRPAVPAEATPDQAMSVLRRSLEEGDLVAHGAPDDAAPRVEIPAHHWIDMQFVSDRNGVEWLRCGSPPSMIAYHDVRFPRRAVLSVWLDHPRSGQPERAEPKLTRIIEDRATRLAIFEKLKIEALFDSKPTVKLARRGLKEGDLSALIAKIQEGLSEGRGLLTFEATKDWAEEQGLSRESARALRRLLPAHLRRTNTDWGP